MAFIPNYTPRVQAEQYKPWFGLRNAIFRQAFDDWRHSPPQAKQYVLHHFARLSPKEREAQFRIADRLKLRWREAAATWMFFHSERADNLLVDTDLTGADVWRMYLDESYNRGGIRDKKYHIPKLPTDRECKLPLPERFGTPDISFADGVFPERKAREIKRQTKKGARK